MSVDPRNPPDDCGDVQTVITSPEKREGTDCGDAAIPKTEQGAPVVPVGVTTVQSCPTKSQRHFQELQVGAGTVQIPDGVLSWSVTVLEGPEACNDPGSPTIQGPNYAGPIPLPQGFTDGACAVGGTRDDVLEGPVDVVGKADTCTKVSWILPGL